MTLDDYFAGLETSRRVFDALADAVGRLGDVDIRVTRTQVAFRRRVGFAYAWVPEKHLGRPGAPLVLTVALRRRDDSPRWKEVVEPAKGRFTHHLELHQVDAVDEEVASWLREAWLASDGSKHECGVHAAAWLAPQFGDSPLGSLGIRWGTQPRATAGHRPCDRARDPSARRFRTDA